MACFHPKTGDQNWKETVCTIAEEKSPQQISIDRYLVIGKSRRVRLKVCYLGQLKSRSKITYIVPQ